MAKIPIEEAHILICNDPIFKKGLTPYNLIINGVVTYKDWQNAMKKHKDPDDDRWARDGHRFNSTAFGRKLLKYVRKLGWTDIEPSYIFKKRSMNTELEAVKLINMKFSVLRID